MAKLSANEAFDLAGELLADLELERLRLSSCAMKTARLARLLGDDDHFLIFKYEIAGYPSTPNGVQPEIWRLCLKALRVRKEKIKKEDSNTEEIVEKADLRSITSIEENAETLKLRLSYFQPQPISISSANPNQIISTPMRNVSLEAQIATNYRNEMTLLAARRAFIYDFVLSKLFELRVSSTAEDIFEEYRKKVDTHLSRLIPNELRRLDSIRDNLASNNPEDWANAGHSCRRLLQAVADTLYPPSDKLVKSAGGREVKVGAENYINRLVMFCESRMASGVSSKVISSDMKFIGERLDAAFSAAQKGSHADIDISEARRFVIHTYLVVGDILELNAESSSPKGKLDATAEVFPDEPASAAPFDSTGNSE
ncbi:AbiTii domain-containing protein [Paenirhodobacter populi]|uniref:AbiTii domain-containing protein n=1 Tax=Paenirhodobacter populi TaxID=2306993 RepID=UPI0013E31DD2|nr:hypothetical protein [Sinirhodobacter populi]